MIVSYFTVCKCGSSVEGCTIKVRIEVESNGTDQRSRRLVVILLFSSVEAPETAILVAMLTMNVHQYDCSYFLDP